MSKAILCIYNVAYILFSNTQLFRPDKPKEVTFKNCISYNCIIHCYRIAYVFICKQSNQRRKSLHHPTVSIHVIAPTETDGIKPNPVTTCVIFLLDTVTNTVRFTSVNRRCVFVTMVTCVRVRACVCVVRMYVRVFARTYVMVVWWGGGWGCNPLSN